jgi:hypothetical protein
MNVMTIKKNCPKARRIGLLGQYSGEISQESGVDADER